MSKKNNHKKKILVIDDDLAILEVLNIILSEKGYEVKTVPDPLGYEDHILKFCPHLILLDIVMPGIDGGQVLKEIRAKEEIREIPVILLSASPELVDLAEINGANAYLAKPFEISRLEEVVEKYIL